MPELARFLIQHALIGFAIAIPFVAMLLALDVGHLRRVAFESEVGIGAVALLTFFVGLTFGSLQMGYAVWQSGKNGPPLPKDPERPPEDDRPLP